MSKQDLIRVVETVRARMKLSGPCKLMDWLHAQSGRRDPNDIRRDLVQHPEWTPAYSVAGLTECDGDDERQVIYAESLKRWPFAETRAPIEHLLRRHGHCLEEKALTILAEIVSEHHPNPKALFLTPAVAGKLRYCVDIQKMPAPDFDECLDLISDYAAVRAACRETEAAKQAADPKAAKSKRP